MVSMFRKILTIVTLILVVFVVWNARNDIMSAIGFLSDTNLFVILLLIPEQLFMYYCAGQIFFSYMKAKSRTESAKSSSESTPIKKISSWTLARISFELNFVNNAIPSGGFAGLGYITWRLKPFGSSSGQTSFMYILRYVITIFANQIQTLIAIAVLILVGGVVPSAWWVIGLTCLISVGVVSLVAVLIVIASNKKRIDWFARVATRFLNKTVKILTFGHKRQVITEDSIENYMADLYKDLQVARENKKILIHPIIWGIVYSFLEIATYWLVAIAMGRPDILPAIMIGEAVASVVGAVMMTPGGVGGYEGTMVFIMSVLGIDPGLATIVVITTRVVVLVGTIVSGYGFYQNAVSKIGKKERDAIMKEAGDQ